LSRQSYDKLTWYVNVSLCLRFQIAQQTGGKIREGRPKNFKKRPNFGHTCFLPHEATAPSAQAEYSGPPSQSAAKTLGRKSTSEPMLDVARYQSSAYNGTGSRQGNREPLSKSVLVLSY